MFRAASSGKVAEDDIEDDKSDQKDIVSKKSKEDELKDAIKTDSFNGDKGEEKPIISEKTDRVTNKSKSSRSKEMRHSLMEDQTFL